MARKKHGDDGGGYNWMDTYGDMVTLLLTFFILLFSMSTVDSAKWEVLVQAFSNTPPKSPQQVAMSVDGEVGDQMVDSTGEYDLMVKDEIDLEHERPVSISELYDFLKAYVEANDMDGSVTLEKDAMNNVYMRFDNNIFFNSDSAVLRQESYPLLTFIGECIKTVEEQIFMVRVVGHTAAVTQKDYPINDWELSSSRANQVVIFFEEQSKFDPQKLMSNGYGKNRPRFANVTAEGRAQNRRVEIMILGNQFDTSNPEQLLSLLQQMTDMQIEESPENSSDILKGDISPEQIPAVGTTPSTSDGATLGETPSSGAASGGTAASAGDTPQSTPPADAGSQNTAPQSAAEPSAPPQNAASQPAAAGAASTG